LYWNFFYSLAYTWWFVLHFRWKHQNYSGLRVQYFTPAFFTIWAFTEMGRLYVGYTGNLAEDVRTNPAAKRSSCTELL